MSAISKLIQASVDEILAHTQFQKWRQSENLMDGDWVVLNNSFVHRDVVGTKKSVYYPTLVCNSAGDLIDLQIVTGSSLNVDFKTFRVRQPNRPTSLKLGVAIKGQVADVGKIVYALIGSIGQDVVQEASFGQYGIDNIVWDSSQKDLLAQNGRSIVIRSPHDEDALWGAFTALAKKRGIPSVSDSAKQGFGDALDDLQRRAEAVLNLPSKKNLRGGITDAIVGVLRKQRGTYGAALAKCKGSPDIDAEAFNQVLRISYNFASDAVPYLRLIVSICDLKPILLWATIGSHYALSEAFRSLPWTRSKHKASLKNYVTVIGDARNAAFHNVFPFQKALRLSLPSNAIQDAELRIFSEYSPRSNSNGFSFQDKEVVDILLGFRRARQRPIPADFWLKNLDVMDRMIDLFDQTSTALKTLYSS